MNKLLMTTALLTALATPAMAANTALAIFAGSGMSFDQGAGFASVGPENFDGVTVSLSFAGRGTSPNDLTEGNINIDNTSTTTQVLHVIAGANGFIGPSEAYELSATVISSTGGASLSGSFLIDNDNLLNGTDEFAHGIDIKDFVSGALTGPESFSFNGKGFDLATTPYGMTEVMDLTLATGASVAVQGISMEASAVPEPRTWAMMAIGFALMAGMGLKRRWAMY